MRTFRHAFRIRITDNINIIKEVFWFDYSYTAKTASRPDLGSRNDWSTKRIYLLREHSSFFRILICNHLNFLYFFTKNTFLSKKENFKTVFFQLENLKYKTRS